MGKAVFFTSAAVEHDLAAIGILVEDVVVSRRLDRGTAVNPGPYATMRPAAPDIFKKADNW
jgi:hypothetical protein